MCIRYIYDIPILGNGTLFPSLYEDLDNCNLLEKFYLKNGDNYNLIEAAKKGNKEAKNLLSFLWKNKCCHYWNYKKKCDNPSFLYDFIVFHKKNYDDKNKRLKIYFQDKKENYTDNLNCFKNIKELVKKSLIVKYGKYSLDNQYIEQLCDYINRGVEEKYKDYNKTNIKKIFKLICDIGNSDNERIYTMHTNEFKDLLYTNIVLPVEGIVSGNYLFEVYHWFHELKEFKFISADKGADDKRKPVKKMPSTPSSLRAKFEKYNIGSLRLETGSKVSKKKKANEALELIDELYEYTNFLDGEYNEEGYPRKKKNIIETIRKSPIEMSLFEAPFDDTNFKRSVFFRSEILRHLSFDKVVVDMIYKRSRDEIFFNIDKLDSAVRCCLKVFLDSPIQCNNIIRIMNNVKERIEAQLAQIEYGDLKRLKNEVGDLEDICGKLIRWIDTRYTAKIQEVSREQSDHVRKLGFAKPTDKQIEMFKKVLLDYRWLFEFDYSWLNEYFGIDGDERIELDKKVKKFIKQINNEALVGSGCEPDNIQKILIYQLCASEDSLLFSTDYKYHTSGRPMKLTPLKKFLDKKAKPDARVSIWLNALMRKQFYVNLGYEDLFDITEDCHNLIADAYKDMIRIGIFHDKLYEKYIEELKKIIKERYEFLGEVMRGEIIASRGMSSLMATK